VKACYRAWAIVIVAAAVWLMPIEPYEGIVAAAKPAKPIRLTLTVSVEEQAGLSSSLTVDSLALTREFRHAKWQTLADRPSLYPDIEATVTDGESSVEYNLAEDGRLWNEARHRLIALSPETARTINALAQTVRRHYYGRKLAWEEARRLIPNKSVFTVTDLQTGLSFRVQRRAGSDHADVQPMSKEDTRVMKQIFDGEWTWKRRAILVRTGNEWIAASMNGMPHGGDGIPDNDFSGHFCVHFYLSTTHKSETPDLTHQLMVHKASGELRPYLDGANPAMLARSYIEALNHRDRTVMRQVAFGMSDEQMSAIMGRMDELDSIRDTTRHIRGRSPQADDWNGQLTAQVHVPVAYRMRSGSQRTDTYRFTFDRAAADSPWRLRQIDSGDGRSNERTA